MYAAGKIKMRCMVVAVAVAIVVVVEVVVVVLDSEEMPEERRETFRKQQVLTKKFVWC